MQRLAMRRAEHPMWWQDVWAKGLARKLWQLGWGLLFVVAMTLLAEFGPRMAYSKMPGWTAQQRSEAMVRAIK